LFRSTISNIYYVTPDLYRKSEVEELGYEKFMHFIDTGIREQHAIAMCHGISIENPNARICVCFGDAFIYRALDQINAATMGGSNMLILGVWPGIQGAQNGKTHQTIGQSAALMAIPELNFYEPADAVDLYNTFSDIFIKNEGVNYVRLSKEAISLDRNKSDEKNIGAYFVHKTDEHPDALIISSGFPLQNAVIAAKELKTEYNISTNVINIIRPKKFEEYAQDLITNDCPILIVYNGSPRILSQYVSDAIISNSNIPRPKSFLSHGFEIGTTGTFDDLTKYYGFDPNSIKAKTLKMMRK
ncbi:MAG: transketolase C-terminal domain-containing protein, partial [Bacilli bacterium]|nr:transketolase C-terminal domain-containing protein [Bacilli bacterium]